MDTPDASDSSKGAIGSFCGSRRTEVKYQDTTDIFGSSNREVCDTPRGSGSSKKEVWGTLNISGFRGTEPWHTHNVSGDRGTEVLERQCKDTDPRKMTAEGSRYTSDTSQQPSAYQEQASIMKKMFETMKEMDNKMKEMFEMIKEMDSRKTKEMFKMIEEMDNRKTKEMFEIIKEMDNKKTRGIPGRAIQIQHQKDEETEILKKQIKKLEARNQELLAKAMAMHQDSEDINDPLRLSALLERYEILRLQEWEKARSSMPYPWSFEEGSYVIRKLFDVCEKDIQQRTNDILKVLDFPLWNTALTKAMIQHIMKLFRQLYQSVSVNEKIIQEADIYVGTESQAQFLLQCCHIYCLLLLQDPPVKAEWKINRRYAEHVDMKDEVNWKKATFLWPIMKCGEEIIVKGVVWE